MKKGVLYIVTGYRHIDEVKKSIVCLRRNYDEMPVHVISDCEINFGFANCTYAFFPKLPSPKEFKIKHMVDTPFDRTLFLDSDVFVLDKIEEVFVLLNKYDMTMAHAPYRQFIELSETPSSFPEFNTGVIAFNKNETVFSFLSNWLLNFYQIGCDRDQPAFRKALYDDENVRHCTLTPEFNCRFNMPGYVCEKVNFLHGRANDIDLIDYEINRSIGPRLHLYRENHVLTFNDKDEMNMLLKLYRRALGLLGKLKLL